MSRYKHYAEITRPSSSTTEDNNNDSNGDWDFGDGGDNGDSSNNEDTIYENYPCNIIDKVQSYDTSEQGENYTGRSEMRGMLTDKLKVGDIVDHQYKIVNKPRIVQNRQTFCSLIKIN